MASPLKPCPNMECKNGSPESYQVFTERVVHSSAVNIKAMTCGPTDESVWPAVCVVRCSNVLCRMEGPRATTQEEADRLWDEAFVREEDDDE